jgi:hypothetical protein
MGLLSSGSEKTYFSEKEIITDSKFLSIIVSKLSCRDELQIRKYNILTAYKNSITKQLHNGYES